MKSYKIWCLGLVLAFVPNVLFGAYALTRGSSGACYVINRIWPDTDSFYYCGHQSNGCAGVVENRRDTPHWYNNKGSFSRDDKTYYCCGGTSSSKGLWTIGSAWYTGSAFTTKKDLGGGKTCNQTKRKTICGTEEVTADCNEPDGCTAGLIFRKVSSASGTASGATSTGVCVAPCAPGTAFESDVSTKCIECPTTNYQGISGENCVKCDAATQFFVYDKSSTGDKRTGRCISKNDTSKVSSYSKTDLQYGRGQTVNTTTVKATDEDESKRMACWVYSDAIEYKTCVTGEKAEASSGSNNNPFMNAYLNGVLIDSSEVANLLSTWNESMGTLVINNADGTKTVKTTRKIRKNVSQ